MKKSGEMHNSFRQMLKKNKLIYGTYSVLHDAKNSVRNYVLDKQAIQNFKAERKMRHRLTADGKIKVGFLIAQNLSTWNKTEPIFFAMQKDRRFDATIICLTPWIGEKRIIFKDKTHNSNYESLVVNPDYKDAKIVNAWLGGDKWIDLKSYDFSYVFCTSPYPLCYPKGLKPKDISKYTKILYTPYGILLLMMFFPMCGNWDFFRNVYCCYCDSNEEKSYFTEQIRRAHSECYQRISFLGYPAMGKFIHYKNDISSGAWNFSKNKYRVLWTPRWTSSDTLAGSNFLKYKDFWLKLIKSKKNMDFCCRPHPLAFGNFIQTGEMTGEEVDTYKKNWETPNSHLDEDPFYASTFWQSDVLVSDFSSILFEYFFTGKPIIFCATQTNREQPTKEFAMILDCCYIAESEADIMSYLAELHDGKDPLKYKRLNVIKEIYGEDIEKIPLKILEDVFQDYKNEFRSIYGIVGGGA